MVCHWCCSRPVLSTNGKSSSGSSRGIHVRAGVEHRTPRRGRKRQPRSVPVLVDEQVLADTVVEIADRMAVVVVVGRAGPLQRRLRAVARSWRRAGRSRSSGSRTGGSRRRPARWTRSRSARRSPYARRPGRSAASRAAPARRAGSTAAAASGCVRNSPSRRRTRPTAWRAARCRRSGWWRWRGRRPG